MAHHRGVPALTRVAARRPVRGAARARRGRPGVERRSGLAELDPATATINNLLLHRRPGGIRRPLFDHRRPAQGRAHRHPATAAVGDRHAGLRGVFAVGSAGGLGKLDARLEALDGADEAARLTSLAPSAEALAPLFTVLALQWIFQMNADGTGDLAQRTMACASDRDAERAVVAFTLLQLVVRSLLRLLIGRALLVLYPLGTGPLDEPAIAASESLHVLGAGELLPAGLRGLLIASLLAALASTIDTHLNRPASYWADALYRGVLLERWLKRAPRPRKRVRVARV